METFKMRYIIILLLFFILVTSCNLRLADLYNNSFRIESTLQESHLVVTISAFENLYYEQNGGNSYFIINQGGVCYQSDLPELYLDSIVSSPPKTVMNSDVTLRYLSKGKQDTLYHIDICELETYEQFDVRREFNVQVEQILYLARSDKRIGKKIWHTEISPTMVLNCE